MTASLSVQCVWVHPGLALGHHFLHLCLGLSLCQELHTTIPAQVVDESSFRVKGGGWVSEKRSAREALANRQSGLLQQMVCRAAEGRGHRRRNTYSAAHWRFRGGGTREYGSMYVRVGRPVMSRKAEST